ncbi:MAG: 1-acyl-sn-glycerol-3-phosphate acyltransferase [Gemmatimonadaceae bacterium]
MGKHSIFVWPVRKLLISLGGIPVRRDSGMNYVDQMVEEFNRRDALVLAIAPEGTRKRVENWRQPTTSRVRPECRSCKWR